MNKWLTYIGGLVGSFALSQEPIACFISELTPLFQLISFIGMLVFAIALIWEGTKTLTQKNS